MKYKHLPLLLTALLVAPVIAGDLSVDDGRVRESIPGQSRSVAYLSVSNRGGEDCRLTSVTSDVARVEIHEHRHSEGKMQMRKLDTLTVPAQETVTLEPGGLHLMLLDLQRPLKAGETVNFTFDAGDCGRQRASFPVRKIQ